jgi:hypothetical protein
LFNEEFHGLNEKAMGMYECLEMKIWEWSRRCIAHLNLRCNC